MPIGLVIVVGLGIFIGFNLTMVVQFMIVGVGLFVYIFTPKDDIGAAILDAFIGLIIFGMFFGNIIFYVKSNKFQLQLTRETTTIPTVSSNPKNNLNQKQIEEETNPDLKSI